MTTQTNSTYRLRQRRGLDVLTWTALDALDVDAIVTTRHGGVSSGLYATLNLSLHVGDAEADVLENRHRAAAALDVSLDDLVFCNQAHGREVRIVTAGDRGRGARRLDNAIDGTDALVTTDPGIVLVIMMADCVPIVLYDPVARVLACVHAGWRGTVARVAEAAVAAMRSLGTRPRDVLAGIGPAIAPDRYQVGPEVADAAVRCFGGDPGEIVRPDGTGRWLFDLWAANHRILRESGVPANRILVAALATGGDPGLFFSDRETRPCGRFAMMARLR